MKYNKGTQPRIKKIQLRVDSLLSARLHQLSKGKEQTMSELIRDAITEKYLKEICNNSK